MSSVPPVIPLRAATVLSRWHLEHRDALVSAINANLEHLQPWMPWAAQPATADSVTTFLQGVIADFDADREFSYGLFAEDGRVLGAGGVHRRGDVDVLEIGYWIAQSQSGQGLGREVARVLTVAAANAPGIACVEIRCDEANARSASIPRALGYDLIEVLDRPKEAPAHTGRGMVWSMPADRARAL